MFGNKYMKDMMEDKNLKPLVSFCILTYNQPNYIGDAITGALSQTYSPLEIIISDDCSTDNTFDIVTNFVKDYNGPHTIVLNRNENNLGIAKHCNKVLYELANGEILLLAGGDDVSLPERTEVSVNTFMKNSNIMSLSFDSKQVDEDLKPLEENIEYNGLTSILNLQDYLLFGDWYIFGGESRAIRREVVKKFPPLSLVNAEDIFIFIRSLMLGEIAFIRKPLVLRRIHKKNESNKAATEKSLQAFLKQTALDISYAYQNSYISEKDKIKLQQKTQKVARLFLSRFGEPVSKKNPVLTFLKLIKRNIHTLLELLLKRFKWQKIRL